MLVEGTTIFKTFLTTHDSYQGQSTGKHSIQITMDGASASRLTKEGVIIKEFEGEPVRKFTSRFNVPVYLMNKELWEEELPSGTKVKINYVTKKHPTAGEVPYVQSVLVQEMGDGSGNDPKAALFADEPQ